jgi:hypothetical protein
MDQPRDQANGVSAVSVGGTIAAMVISIVVLAVVAVIVGALVTLFNYYMSSMRIEAAGFFGAIFGGWAGTYAARASCDAILKAYHQRAVFFLLAAFVTVGFYVEFVILPVGWRTITPAAQLAAIGLAGWTYFWVGGEL